MDDKIWNLIEKYTGFPKPSKLASDQLKNSAVVGGRVRLSADEADKPFIEIYEKVGDGVKTHRKTLTDLEVEKIFDELTSLYDIPRHSYFVEIKLRVGEMPKANISTYLFTI